VRSRAEVSEKRQYVVAPPQAPLQGRNTWPSSSPSKFASEAESFPKCEKKKTVDVISLGGEALAWLCESGQTPKSDVEADKEGLWLPTEWGAFFGGSVCKDYSQCLLES
jgi:hypothetical protein